MNSPVGDLYSSLKQKSQPGGYVKCCWDAPWRKRPRSWNEAKASTLLKHFPAELKHALLSLLGWSQHSCATRSCRGWKITRSRSCPTIDLFWGIHYWANLRSTKRLSIMPLETDLCLQSRHNPTTSPDGWEAGLGPCPLRPLQRAPHLAATKMGRGLVCLLLPSLGEGGWAVRVGWAVGVGKKEEAGATVMVGVSHLAEHPPSPATTGQASSSTSHPTLQGKVLTVPLSPSASASSAMGNFPHGASTQPGPYMPPWERHWGGVFMTWRLCHNMTSWQCHESALRAGVLPVHKAGRWLPLPGPWPLCLDILCSGHQHKWEMVAVDVHHYPPVGC